MNIFIDEKLESLITEYRELVNRGNLSDGDRFDELSKLIAGRMAAKVQTEEVMVKVGFPSVN